MASGSPQEDGDVGLQIAPMVDVVFVLLLFFMAAAGSQQVSRELSSNLPSHTPCRPGTVIPIEILADGRVQVNGRMFDSTSTRELPELTAWLAQTIEKFGPNDPVIVYPSPQTTHQRVIDVLNAATAAGVTKLTFG
jgi:biopolymer transport protein ExbD